MSPSTKLPHDYVATDDITKRDTTSWRVNFLIFFNMQKKKKKRKKKRNEFFNFLQGAHIAYKIIPIKN